MQLQENKQYTMQFSFSFPRDEVKEVICHVFLYDEKIYAVSFVDGKNFVKAAYDKDTKELLFFENYANNVISFSDITINKFTSCVSKTLKENNKAESFNINLLKEFDLTNEDFSIKRIDLRFSLPTEQEHNLSKHVEFISDYGYSVSDRGYLHLKLLKNKNIFSYCIEDYKFNSICKFVFKLEKLPDGNIFHLIRRTNYREEGKLFDFNQLNQDFYQLNNTSEEMHRDKADTKFNISDVYRYSDLYNFFERKGLSPLPLFI